MTVLYLVAGAVLLAAAVLAIVRAERGPSMLDRAVALDVFATVLVGGVVLESAWSRRLDALPVLVALSMVGFVSSTVIARFMAAEPGRARRIRTAEEVALDDARRRAEEDAADEAARHAAAAAAAEQERADELAEAADAIEHAAAAEREGDR